MKKKFSVVEGSDVREEGRQEQPETLGYGVAFLKTRAADFKIREMQLALEELEKEIGILIICFAEHAIYSRNGKVGFAYYQSFD